MILICFIFLTFIQAQTLPDRNIDIMFWNMENFFDYKDGGGGESDTEFSSFGSRRWTKKRFQAKCHAVAKTIFWMKDRNGQLPDIIGLAEIENRNVLYRLLKDTALKKTDYAFIHFDGSDRRGIDVAIIYRKSVMTPLSITRRRPVTDEGDTLQTRDILHVHMDLESASEGHQGLDFIVNHHPSKYGGQEQSRHKRHAAMKTLRSLVDSINTVRPGSKIIAMGDFNDTPDSEPFEIISRTLVNKGAPLHEKGLGTIRYEGKWDLIDMFLVSPEIDAHTRMEIVKVPFLMVRDTKHPGEKPLRTYSGPKHLGGVSDHCPIILKIQ